jgi:hypothetical protein
MKKYRRLAVTVLLVVILATAITAFAARNAICPYDGKEAFPTGNQKGGGLTASCEYKHSFVQDGKLVTHVFWANCNGM